MRKTIIHEPSLTARYHTARGWTVIELIVELDVATVPWLRMAVLDLLDHGHRHFVLDLCPTTFVDSMGLGMIVSITKRIRDTEGSLRLACVDPRLLTIFKTVGLHQVYSFSDSAEEATQHPPHRGGLARWPLYREP